MTIQQTKGGPQSAKISLACSNRPLKSSTDSERACKSFAHVSWANKRGRYFRQPQVGLSACAERAPECQNFTGLLESAPKTFCGLAASLQVICARQMGEKERSVFWSTLGGSERMRREGPRVPKVHWLARIGPKKVVRTRSEPSSHLRASDGQKKRGRYFRQQ